MENLSRRLSELSAEKQKLLAQALQQQGETFDAFAMSFAQQRLWLLDQMDPDNSVYNVRFMFHLTGPLKVAVLEQSLNEIVRRHEVLRTTYLAVNEVPVQVIAPVLTMTLPITDLREVPTPAREDEVTRLITEEAQRPFNLARDPLVRAILLCTDEQEHVLLLTMHHIVSDGWSVGVLFRELGTLYDAYSADRPSPLPALPIQYVDFAHWQRQWLQGAVLDDQLAYWREQLRHASGVLELPLDRPRPLRQTFHGERYTFTVPQPVVAGLAALSHREGVTMFMTLLAVFQTLLHRYSGQDDIVVGSPIAGRTRAEIEDLIGVFVNMLVLRTDFSGDPPFRDLLGRVREVALGAYAHQDLPFERLVEELRPRRDLSLTPLFQAVFALQNAPLTPLELQGLTLRPLAVDSVTTKFDLTLSMQDTPGGLEGMLEYNTDLFDPGTIMRLCGHFQTMLASIVDDPQQHLSGLSLLTAAEQQQMFIDWNDTGTDCPPAPCLQHLFEEQTSQTPHAVALVYDGAKLTYQQLNQRANRVAHDLQRLGVGPEVRVGICINRSLEMVVGLLGILKAGGVYVPLDPTYPTARLTFMLEDSQAPVLVTQRHLAGRVPNHRATTLYVDADGDVAAPIDDVHPTSPVSAENLAYVMYTSGSTGRPKGILIPHRGLVNYLTWAKQAYSIEAGEGAPVHSSLSFDLTITGLFAPLLAGRTVHLLPEDRGVEALGDTLRSEGNFSLVKLTPAHLDLLSQQLPPQEASERTRAFIIGGEKLLPQSTAFWQKYAPETLLVNEYGPTETVVGCCVYRMCAGHEESGLIPIGRPIANTQLYVLDAHLQPVPIGVPGELYIGGAGLARGYLRQPALTAERFIPHPFGSEPGARLYRTGDLVRYLPSGDLDYLGRIDQQVKVRGFRIEPGEIEAVLEQYPFVQDAVVVVRESVDGDSRLVAYVVPQRGYAPASGELRDFLRQAVPTYMIPTAFVLLSELPLTLNGKVDRAALPTPETIRSEGDRPGVAARTDVERAIAAIWREVLQIEQVGVRDNFFDLGGHSLLLLRVQVRLGEELGRRIALMDMFSCPTIELLANHLTQDQPASALADPMEQSYDRGKRKTEAIHLRGQRRKEVRPV